LILTGCIKIKNVDIIHNLNPRGLYRFDLASEISNTTFRNIMRQRASNYSTSQPNMESFLPNHPVTNEPIFGFTPFRFQLPPCVREVVGPGAPSVTATTTSSAATHATPATSATPTTSKAKILGFGPHRVTFLTSKDNTKILS